MALEELMGVVLCGFLAFLAYRLGRSSSLLDLLFHFIFLVLGLVVCQLGLGADVVAFTMLLVFASGILILIALGLHLSPEHPNETVVKLKVWKFSFCLLAAVLVLTTPSFISSKPAEQVTPKNNLYDVGKLLIESHLLVFELAGLFLTVVLVMVVHILSSSQQQKA